MPSHAIRPERLALKCLVHQSVNLRDHAYKAEDYVSHIRMYGDRLDGANYVGVGSICKRNTDVAVIEDVLTAIRKS